jgi:hypothetical protein
VFFKIEIEEGIIADNGTGKYDDDSCNGERG